MRSIDDDAIELTYEEYLDRAKQLQEENPSFVVYPPRPGVTYCYAYNKHNRVYRLLTLKEYITLRDYGLWGQGIDRLKSSNVDKKAAAKAKEASKDAKAAKKLQALTSALVFAHKTCTTYEDLEAAVKQILMTATRTN